MHQEKSGNPDANAVDSVADFLAPESVTRLHRRTFLPKKIVLVKVIILCTVPVIFYFFKKSHFFETSAAEVLIKTYFGKKNIFG
jgi:hypothetical protein